MTAAGIYPNPSQGISTLLSRSDITQVKVYDSKGINIINIQNIPTDFSYGSDEKNIIIDLSSYPSGVYFVFAWKENSLVYNTSLIKK